jgi:hypothetical protein
MDIPIIALSCSKPTFGIFVQFATCAVYGDVGDPPGCLARLFLQRVIIYADGECVLQCFASLKWVGAKIACSRYKLHPQL